MPTKYQLDFRFIEKYGTHVVVGVKMGGKDVIFMRQLRESKVEQTDVQKKLKKLADDKFSEDANGGFTSNSVAAKIKVPTQEHKWLSPFGPFHWSHVKIENAD